VGVERSRTSRAIRNERGPAFHGCEIIETDVMRASIGLSADELCDKLFRNPADVTRDAHRAIKGRELDLYLSKCDEAEQFGRRTMRVAVIRRGWDPAALPGEAQR
jgi:hypothetical protein